MSNRCGRWLINSLAHSNLPTEACSVGVWFSRHGVGSLTFTYRYSYSCGCPLPKITLFSTWQLRKLCQVSLCYIRLIFAYFRGHYHDIGCALLVSTWIEFWTNELFKKQLCLIWWHNAFKYLSSMINSCHFIITTGHRGSQLNYSKRFLGDFVTFVGLVNTIEVLTQGLRQTPSLFTLPIAWLSLYKPYG